MKAPTLVLIKSLDVWGNSDDGYEINDMHTAGTVDGWDIDYIWSKQDNEQEFDAALISTLCAYGYLKIRARDHVHCEELSETSLTIVDSKSGEPLYQVDWGQY